MLAERVGFEPTVPCGITGFQDQLLKPLGHLSIMRLAALLKPLSFSDLFSLPQKFSFVNSFFQKNVTFFISEILLYTFGFHALTKQAKNGKLNQNNRLIKLP